MIIKIPQLVPLFPLFQFLQASL